jgi:hypothetical protein
VGTTQGLVETTFILFLDNLLFYFPLWLSINNVSFRIVERVPASEIYTAFDEISRKSKEIDIASERIEPIRVVLDMHCFM